MPNNGIIFIPDISGFTEFVTQTESRHSSHIIAELIEEIIKANILDLKISEIEGDAVLFYKFGDPPDFRSALEQVSKIFTAFHYYLKIIERDNVCRCGACLNASGLTLKFVLHFGEFQIIDVHDHVKLMGADVILAHRLLKNNIPLNQYFLITDSYSAIQQDLNPDDYNWVTLKDYTEEYEKFGSVEIKATDLSKLIAEVPVPPEDEKLPEAEGEYNFSIEINASIADVHAALIDSETKYEWVEGVKNISQASPINRVNSSHTCIFEDLEIHFVTKANKKRNETINYLEEADAGFGFTVISDFKLSPINGGTRLSVRFLPGYFDKKKSFISRLYDKVKYRIAVNKLLKSSKQNLARFKNYCENRFSTALQS